MADSFTVGHLGAQPRYDLEQLYDVEQSVDEPSDSPFENCQNTCLYYEPVHVSKIFSEKHAKGCVLIGTHFIIYSKN